MDADEGAEAFAIDEARGAHLDVDEFVFGFEGGADEVPQHARVGGAEVLEFVHHQGVPIGMCSHG